MLDLTGADCGVGQSGPVFFLAGVSGTGSVTRDCTVPAGKALFFPLVNGFDVHTPGDGLDTPQPVWDDMHVTFGFAVTTLFATVDGRAIVLDPSTAPYRACAGPDAACTAPDFSLTVPDGNILGIAAGTYAPAVADGSYLLLAPLAPGAHTMTFGGTGVFGAAFSQNVTYHLVVSAT